MEKLPTKQVPKLTKKGIRDEVIRIIDDHPGSSGKTFKRNVRNILEMTDKDDVHYNEYKVMKKTIDRVTNILYLGKKNNT